MGAVVKRKKQTNTNSLPLWPRGDAMCVSVCVCSAPQLFLPLCNPKSCTPPGSSVHGISQARILDWVATSFFRGSSKPRNQTYVSYMAGRFFTTEPSGSPKISISSYKSLWARSCDLNIIILMEHVLYFIHFVF